MNFFLVKSIPPQCSQNRADKNYRAHLKRKREKDVSSINKPPSRGEVREGGGGQIQICNSQRFCPKHQTFQQMRSQTRGFHGNGEQELNTLVTGGDETIDF